MALALRSLTKGWLELSVFRVSTCLCANHFYGWQAGVLAFLGFATVELIEDTLMVWIGKARFCDICGKPATCELRLAATVLAELCEKHSAMTEKHIGHKLRTKPGPLNPDARVEDE